jgi:CheY-like chemotaxis protein/HPt (histidine-containing phosphotransfer) domain-containing protein
MARPEPAGRGRVLLVEDDVLNQIVAVGILGRLGYHADVAENGREAVAAVERGAYRAVLMDCRMPEMDGYQATAEIRRREGTARHVPVIAMTASATQADRDRCLAAGMDDFIAKPVLVDDLGAVLSRWLPAGFPAPPATTEPPREVLDHRRLDSLRELDDGQGSRLLTRLVAAFLSGAPADLAGLRAAVERGDARAMGDVAHHLKGAAATLGGSRIVELCEDIESLAGADAVASAAGLLGPLGEELDRARTALAAAVPGAEAR